MKSKKQKKTFKKKNKTKRKSKILDNQGAIHVRLAINVYRKRRKENSLKGKTVWRSKQKVELSEKILKNFNKNEKLSSSDYGVYIDNKNKHVILSIRGTDMMQSLMDLYYDYKIVVGEETETSYYKDAYKLLKKIIKKYKNFKITLTGFSLGGRIVINLLDSKLGDYVSGVYSFNPATLHHQIFKSNECKLSNPKWCKNRNKLKIFLVNGDSISSFAVGEKCGSLRLFNKNDKVKSNHSPFTFYYEL